eukprot:Sdes_comp18282_c0_seq1m7951
MSAYEKKLDEIQIKSQLEIENLSNLEFSAPASKHFTIQHKKIPHHDPLYIEPNQMEQDMFDASSAPFSPPFGKTRLDFCSPTFSSPRDYSSTDCDQKCDALCRGKNFECSSMLKSETSEKKKGGPEDFIPAKNI